MYTEAAAARLLRVAPSTLHWWLEGRPSRYRPVIRPEPTGSRPVTWAEFVEAGLLRSYRRDHDVPLREFIDRLREEFRVLYPLADRRPYVDSGRRPLIDLQDRSHLDPEFCLVANRQVVLTAPGEEFYERVDWCGDEPAGWRPHEDPDSPVRINPLVRFGMPRSAASPPRPSRASLTAEHPLRKLPATSVWILTRCGGLRVMSCHSAPPHEPAGGAGPHICRC
jgi:hypothetical protein